MSVVDHGHENILRGGKPLNRAALESSTTSLSGSIAIFNRANIVMGAYVFFPMIQADGSNLGILMGHPTDGADPDSGRFSIMNISFGTAINYDVDYRQLTA